MAIDNIPAETTPESNRLSPVKLKNECKLVLKHYLDSGNWSYVDRKLNGKEKKRFKRLYSVEFADEFKQVDPVLRRALFWSLFDLMENSKSEGIKLEANKEMNKRLNDLRDSALKGNPHLEAKNDADGKGYTKITQNNYFLALESLKTNPIGANLIHKLLNQGQDPLSIPDNNTYQASEVLDISPSPTTQTALNAPDSTITPNPNPEPSLEPKD